MDSSIKNASLSKQIEIIFQQMHDSIGNFFIKDMQGRYICFNANFLQTTSVQQKSMLLGKTDYELPWIEYAESLRKNDLIAIESRSNIKLLEVVCGADSAIKVYSVYKEPFYHNNEVVGVVGLSLEIPLSLLQNTIVLSSTTCFIDLKRRKSLRLTMRQKEILLQLIRGYTAKDVANYLSISHRTVEHHIVAIKSNNKYASLREIVTNVRAV